MNSGIVRNRLLKPDLFQIGICIQNGDIFKARSQSGKHGGGRSVGIDIGAEIDQLWRRDIEALGDLPHLAAVQGDKFNHRIAPVDSRESAQAERRTPQATPSSVTIETSRRAFLTFGGDGGENSRPICAARTTSPP